MNTGDRDVSQAREPEAAPPNDQHLEDAGLGGGVQQAGEDVLFAAFLAGFEESGEGFNGEYVGRRYRGEGVLEAHLRRWYFSAWREGREVDYAAMREYEADGS